MEVYSGKSLPYKHCSWHFVKYQGFFFFVIFRLDPTKGSCLVEESLYFIIKKPRSKNKPHPQIIVIFNLSTWVVHFHIYLLFCYSFPLVFSRSECKRKSSVLYAVLRTKHHILLLKNRLFHLQDITAKPFPSSLALWHSSWDKSVERDLAPNANVKHDGVKLLAKLLVAVEKTKIYTRLKKKNSLCNAIKE